MLNMEISVTSKRPLTERQKQVILTGTFGDGCIVQYVKGCAYRTNCIHEDYMHYKSELLGDLSSGKITEKMNQGYKKAPIYSLSTCSVKEIEEIHKLSIEDKLKLLTPLGLSLWFYDDGSLHKHSLFYNLNTHSFTEEVHNDLFVPYFDSIGYGRPKVLKERKKDGREFNYLYFNKHEGGHKINKLLNEYPVPCFEYKRWPKNFEIAWDQVLNEGVPYSRVAFTKKVKSLVKEIEKQKL